MVKLEKNDVVYPPCKYCGKAHGMGIEETATGKIEPIDICYDCLWRNLTILTEGEKK